MELDPLTIVLEITNFLVLLWLLKRFLYKPVKGAIAQRQAALEQGLKDAEEREQKAEVLAQQHQQELEQWAQEKAQQQTELQQQMVKEREQAMSKIHAAAEAEEQRLSALRQQDQSQLEQHMQHQAVQSALQLTRRMLERLAGAKIDEQLINMVQQDLQTLPEEEKQALSQSLKQQQGKVQLCLAHEISDTELESLKQTLSNVLGQTVDMDTQISPELISGVRISIGAHVLHANLVDELAFFQRSLNHG